MPDRGKSHNKYHGFWHGAHSKDLWKESWTQTIYWCRTGKGSAITFTIITYQNTVTQWTTALYTMSTRMARAPEAPFAPGARRFLVQRRFSTAISSSPISRWTASTCAVPTEVPQSRSRERGHARSWSAVDGGYPGGGEARARPRPRLTTSSKNMKEHIFLKLWERARMWWFESVLEPCPFCCIKSFARREKVIFRLGLKVV